MMIFSMTPSIRRVVRTGNATLDNILTVILSSSMFLAMTLGFVLDNTIPGTDEERGEYSTVQYSTLGTDEERGAGAHLIK